MLIWRVIMLLISVMGDNKILSWKGNRGKFKVLKGKKNVYVMLEVFVYFFRDL